MHQLIIASKMDEASMSMAEFILDKGEFREFKPGLYMNSNRILAFIDEKHLFWEDPGMIERETGEAPRDIVFLSRHSSAADIKSVTVHPTGNFRNTADLGGMPRALSMADPETMTGYLKFLRTSTSLPGVEITFEATHHGPLLDIPNFYFEIGTTAEQWTNEEILNSCYETIMGAAPVAGGNFVGVGGGHYMSKITEYVVENNVNVGHMISKHSLVEIDRDMIIRAVERTPGCAGFLVDRKGVKSKAKEIVDSISDEYSLEKIVV